MKCNILSTHTFKNYGNFTDHNLEKFCPRSLASTIPALFLASRRSVLEKLVLGFDLGSSFFSALGFGLKRCVLNSTCGKQ